MDFIISALLRISTLIIINDMPMDDLEYRSVRVHRSRIRINSGISWPAEPGFGFKLVFYTGKKR